jgi:hypothetical protein
MSLLISIQRITSSFDENCAKTLALHSSVYEVVDNASKNQTYWLEATACPGVPGLVAATSLVQQALWATGCILDLFDEAFLLQHLRPWMETPNHQDLPLSSLYYLIFAIGTQASLDGDSDLERQYFNHGQYLTTRHSNQGITVRNTQCHTLITWYLLAAGRVNDAYIHLGTAIRAAYALGLHTDQDIGRPDEAESRTKLWKVVRILDGFLSMTLGRPQSLRGAGKEARINGAYSACLDLCAIFDSVLEQISANRTTSPEAVEKISAQHRRWAAGFHKGLETDHIKVKDPVQLDGVQLPNIGLYHLREGYYRSVILLTLPFLAESASDHILSSMVRTDESAAEEKPRPGSDRSNVYACVNAAISIIEMAQDLQSSKKLPKRLPFMVHSVFLSALIVGLSFFGDLDHVFPLKRYLFAAGELLAQLGRHDPAAKVSSAVVKSMRDTCRIYVDERDLRRRVQRNTQIKSLFGDISSPRTRSRLNIHKPTNITPLNFAELTETSATRAEDDLYREQDLEDVHFDEDKSTPPSMTASEGSSNSRQPWLETDISDPECSYLEPVFADSTVSFCLDVSDDISLSFEDPFQPVVLC